LSAQIFAASKASKSTEIDVFLDREVSEEASKSGESTEIDAFCVAKQVKKHRNPANLQKSMPFAWPSK